jgi:hypothetical protein
LIFGGAKSVCILQPVFQKGAVRDIDVRICYGLRLHTTLKNKPKKEFPGVQYFPRARTAIKHTNIAMTVEEYNRARPSTCRLTAGLRQTTGNHDVTDSGHIKTTPRATTKHQQQSKFRSPRRFNVLAHEDMHRASYRRTLTSIRKVRFASVVDVGRPVCEEPLPRTSLWHSDQDYAAFLAEIKSIVERYRRGCRSDDVLGLEHFLRPI